MPYIPTDAPFSVDQRNWLVGFIAGLNSQKLFSPDQVAVGATSSRMPIHILFGTQTGNAEELANDAAVLARQRGYEPHVSELDAVEMDKFASMERTLIVVSTYGEGEMPDNAEIFWQSLSASTAPRLEQMSFAVLGLGDTSYDEFCQAGKLIDTRLEQLGATRLIQRIDCDVDYEEPATAWLDDALIEQADALGEISNTSDLASKKTDAKWNKRNPYSASLLENKMLSKTGSAKEIRHIVFDLSDSELTYRPGDSLGVLPKNAPDLINSILSRLDLSGDEIVEGYDIPMFDLLSQHFEIMTPSKDLIRNIERLAKDENFSGAMKQKESLDKYLWGKDVLDLLNVNMRLKLNPKEFLDWLRPLQHRAYSISSCQQSVGEQVHLTVAAVRWNHDERIHKGVASTFLADQLAENDTARVFISENKNFRIPEDNDAPMIMVGPGTGIAPFRAFLQERQITGATGMNWLFFGDQHRKFDFLYEKELSKMSSDGLLTRLDLAFSRDQSEKVYVQSRMAENGRSLFEALESGGHFYVCGDASKMAKDVDDALHQLIAKHGGLSQDNARAYVNDLKRQKRYLRDVY